MTPSPEPFRCEKCGYTTSRRFNLQRHVSLCKQQILLHPRVTENIFFLLTYPLPPSRKEDVLTLLYTITVTPENLKELILKVIEISPEDLVEEMLTRSYQYYEQSITPPSLLVSTITQIKEYLSHLQQDTGLVSFHKKKISTVIQLLHSLITPPEVIVIKDMAHLFHVEHTTVLLKSILD